VPVLAVTPALTHLPNRVAVAVDFSRASLRAARAAVDIIAPNGTLYVVYVRPKMERTEESEGANIIHAQGLAGAFARLRKELSVPRGIDVEAVLLEGEPAAELISFADRAEIDVIAVGSHKHPFLTRMLVGSVTTELVRSARHSLLVAPPSREGSV
jgi:nucleotide-binding universal stress UspA family protein